MSYTYITVPVLLAILNCRDNKSMNIISSLVITTNSYFPPKHQVVSMNTFLCHYFTSIMLLTISKTTVIENNIEN